MNLFCTSLKPRVKTLLINTKTLIDFDNALLDEQKECLAAAGTSELVTRAEELQSTSVSLCEATEDLVIGDKIASDFLQRLNVEVDFHLLTRMYVTWLDTDTLNFGREHLFFLYVAVWLHIKLLQKYHNKALAKETLKYAHEVAFALIGHVRDYSVLLVAQLFKTITPVEDFDDDFLTALMKQDEAMHQKLVEGAELQFIVQVLQDATSQLHAVVQSGFVMKSDNGSK